MTREEFESILEEAFLAGYNDAIDEIFEEDNTFDLEDEMDSYNETKLLKGPATSVKKYNDFLKKKGISDEERKNVIKSKIASYSGTGRSWEGVGSNQKDREINNSFKYEKPLNRKIKNKTDAYKRMFSAANRYENKVKDKSLINKMEKLLMDGKL